MKQVQISIGLLSILSGHLQFHKIDFFEPTLVFKSLDFPKAEGGKQEPFKLTNFLRFPVTNLNIHDMNLQLREQNDIPTTNIINLSLELKTANVCTCFYIIATNFAFAFKI